MPLDHFGEDVAAHDDQSAGSMFDDDGLGPTVDVLAELAGDGATGGSAAHVSVWEKTD